MLPGFTPPTTLGEAAATIAALGRDLHEHAYQLGKLLLWVKSTVVHGEFLPWISNNVWFSPKTAERFMAFAIDCDTESKLLEYGPSKFVMVANLPETQPLFPTNGPPNYEPVTLKDGPSEGENWNFPEEPSEPESDEQTEPPEEPNIPHVARATGENEWYTPPAYITAARAVMGKIDCDPASSEIANRIVGATKFFTKEDSGLQQTWGDEARIFCNPPYSQPLVDQFSAAIVAKFSTGEVAEACVLVNNATETEWFQRMLHDASAVCFPKGRVKFLNPEGEPVGAPLQGQAVLYFGPHLVAFKHHFGSFGEVFTRE
jgi:ParB family chromosome partitioning protein